MSDYTRTPFLNLYKPTPNADPDVWGGHLNWNADTLDTTLNGLVVGAGGPWLPTAGGTVTGTTNFTMPGGTSPAIANFFRYGYGATTSAVGIQSAGSSTSNTAPAYNTLVVSTESTHDDGITGAYGAIYSSLQINGKQRTDQYAIHGVTYTNNVASDLTPQPGGDGTSQHGGLCIQTVKNPPSGGMPSGKRGPDVFSHWWQNINTMNVGSAVGGADALLEADIVGNGPDDMWKLSAAARHGNTTSGSPTITGITDTSPFTVGQQLAVSQTGDLYILCRVASIATNVSVTMDTNATATLTGVTVGAWSGLRFAFQNVLSLNTMPASGGKSFEWSFGHYQNDAYGGPSGIAVWGVGFAYYGKYYVAASDYSAGNEVPSPYSADGINRGAMIKLRAGQKIVVDGDGYRGTWLTGVAGGGLQLVKDGTPVLSLSATGQITFATLPTNAANDGAAASAGVIVGGMYRNGSAVMVRAA